MKTPPISSLSITALAALTCGVQAGFFDGAEQSLKLLKAAEKRSSLRKRDLDAPPAYSADLIFAEGEFCRIFFSNLLARLSNMGADVQCV